MMKFEYALSINSTEIMSDTKKAIQPHNGVVPASKPSAPIRSCWQHCG